MKNVLFSTLFLLSALTVKAQETISETLSSISGIDINGKIKVTLIKSNENSFQAEVDGAKLEWEVKNGVAKFTLKKPIQIGGEKEEVVANMVIKYKEIDNISAAAGATITSKETLSGDVIELTTTTSGVIGLTLKYNDVRVKTNSNGVATLSGKSKYLTVKSATYSSVNCGDLVVEVANITAQTNSECYVNATEKLDARAATNANIFYKVEPELKNVSASTLGSVQKY